VYTDMKKWEEIRHRVLREGVSKREILREEGFHWRTLEKILEHSTPPGYRTRKPRRRPKIGPFEDRIRQILKEDAGVVKKQRHTAKRIFERLREEGYTGGATQAKEAVRRIRKTQSEVFMPLTHRPGEAQVDFGYVLVKEAGVLRRVPFFVMSLPHSGAFFVQVFERICMEVFWEAHIRAFEFLKGVPHRITYDNESIFVSKILGPHERKLTDGFLELKSHYLFDAHFCRVRRPNEKGVVERIVRYARQNFMVPVPQVRCLEGLNEALWEQCYGDLHQRPRGKKDTKMNLLEEESGYFLPVPEAPFDACRKRSTTVNSLSLVRFDCNDYSVPVRYAHHPVVVKGYTDRVEITYQDERIAEHERSWKKEGVEFEPLHYLALLERKPGALDFARPLEGWQLPDCFGVLRRRLEQEEERKGDGTREYIRVLRLMEQHPMRDLADAVEKALGVGALSRDAIAQFLYPQEDWTQRTFRLDGREHLRRVQVMQTRICAYAVLMGEGL
jgi:transposase